MKSFCIEQNKPIIIKVRQNTHFMIMLLNIGDPLATQLVPLPPAPPPSITQKSNEALGNISNLYNYPPIRKISINGSKSKLPADALYP